MLQPPARELRRAHQPTKIAGLTMAEERWLSRSDEDWLEHQPRGARPQAPPAGSQAMPQGLVDGDARREGDPLLDLLPVLALLVVQLAGLLRGGRRPHSSGGNRRQRGSTKLMCSAKRAPPGEHAISSDFDIPRSSRFRDVKASPESRICGTAEVWECHGETHLVTSCQRTERRLKPCPETPFHTTSAACGMNLQRCSEASDRS